jgi:hypothetical protein
MESSGQAPAEPEVPLADASIAAEIARAAAQGRGADRSPTLEQLLSAFGEREPTDAARRRVRAALAISGMGVRPDLLEAEPGQRLLLLPPGSARGRARGRALLGLLALAGVLAIAVAAAALIGSGGKSAGDALPAGTSTRAAAPSPGPTTTTATPAPATASTATPAASSATPTTTATTPAADTAAADRRRARLARIKAARQAAAHRLVTVRVDATARPTFLCVDDGHGRQLFGGTLDGAKVFKERRVRLNIGLASTRVTVNGAPVRLVGSPAGLDVTRRGGARALPLGRRPCA